MGLPLGSFVVSVAPLAHLECVWCMLWGRIGASGGVWNASWRRLGAILGRLGRDLGGSWGVLGASWEPFGSFLKDFLPS